VPTGHQPLRSDRGDGTTFPQSLPVRITDYDDEAMQPNGPIRALTLVAAAAILAGCTGSSATSPAATARTESPGTPTVAPKATPSAMATQAASQAIVASAVPPDLAAALAANGTHLSAPAAGVPAPNAEALKSAIDVARAQFGPAGSLVAIPAILTVDSYRVGDENSPLAIEDRPVIAVQITGLSMPPMGGRPGDPPVDPSDYNTELVVFVDAATGEYLLASSVR